MTGEALAYRPAGSGHSGAPRKGKGYVQPDDVMINIFTEWLDRTSYDARPGSRYDTDLHGKAKRDYDLAWRLIPGEPGLFPGIEGMTFEEINAVLPPLKDHPNFNNLGPFVSVAYKKAGVTEIIFDVDCGRPNWLGFNMDPENRLLIYSDTGGCTGTWSRATVINFGRCDHLSAPSEALINFGHERNPQMTNNRRRLDRYQVMFKGLIIDIGQDIARFYETPRPIHLYKEGGAPELEEYLESVKRFFSPERPREELLKRLKGTDKVFEKIKELAGWEMRRTNER